MIKQIIGKLIRKSSGRVPVNSPGELRPFFKRLDHFDDVRGVPGASALRHFSAASPSCQFVLAEVGGDLSLRIRRRFATAR